MVGPVLLTVTRSNLCPRPRFSRPDPPSLVSRCLPGPRLTLSSPLVTSPCVAMPCLPSRCLALLWSMGHAAWGAHTWKVDDGWPQGPSQSHPGPPWCHGATGRGISPPQRRPSHPSQPQLVAALLAILRMDMKIGEKEQGFCSFDLVEICRNIGQSRQFSTFTS